MFMRLEKRNNFYTTWPSVIVPKCRYVVSFTEWLELFKNCFVVHNLTFDGPRLFRAIFNVDEFAEVIYSFTDMLHVFRKITGRRGKNGCSIQKN
jgi:hypothetical protein